MDQADWHAKGVESATEGPVAGGSTCGPYYARDPALPRSCVGSCQLRAVPGPAGTLSICVRDVPATCVGSQEWQKKRTGVGLACGTAPTRLSYVPGESARESRTLPRHRPS